MLGGCVEFKCLWESLSGNFKKVVVDGGLEFRRIGRDVCRW